MSRDSVNAQLTFAFDDTDHPEAEQPANLHVGTDTSLQERALQAVHDWCMQANALLAPSQAKAMPQPHVCFDLRGRAAGVTVFKRRGPKCGLIRLNADLLLAAPEEMINETVPHEVAHAAARWFHGPRIKPHGCEWQAIMHAFGKQATTCHELPTQPARRVLYYPYACGCPRPNYLSAIRHRRMQDGQRLYQCTRCQQNLTYTGGKPTRGHPNASA